MKNMGFLIDGNGQVTIGRSVPVSCATIAVNEDQCMAMLVRREGESFMDLLARFDAAIEKAHKNEIFID